MFPNHAPALFSMRTGSAFERLWTSAERPLSVGWTSSESHLSASERPQNATERPVSASEGHLSASERSLNVL